MDKSRSTSFIKDEKPVQRPCLKKSSTLATILNKAKRCSPVTVEYRQEEVDLHQPVQFMDVDEYEADKSQLRNDFMNLAFTEEFRSTVDFTKLEQGRILDVGCGSGAWCIDMANKYPTIQVIGIDNEDWFPDPSCIPTNCQLLHTNILNALSSQFDLSSFDFIHIRLMALVFTRQQYDLATRYCWNLLKPGATLELLEMDIEMCSAGPMSDCSV
ncbi:S-adenosyl-L-methionine-dependent methyltransferase [Chlamydoabsidia padenii]|nr:S-adenosyl-L-methionine-dependent methyltransferase [Chlamydoabsidia padenii]